MPRNAIQFYLADTLHTVSDVDPNTTVLKYLRHQLNRSGTKEGCGSGDCGACTVVVGEVQDGRIRYQSINSCITLIGCLDGKQLLTVEDLSVGNELHPVQQAMVDQHGSQCGFCTPGIVMSLFALRENHTSPTTKEAQEALAGNLCRCTGYRPILAAAQQPFSTAPPSTETLSQLQLLATERDEVEWEATLGGEVYRYFAPNSVSQLIRRLKAYPDARLVAGGTDLSLEVTQRLRRLPTLIYLGKVVEMKLMEERNQILRLGAAVSLTECHDLLSRHYPDLGHMLERFGSSQIRNQGTVGGNIANASPVGDMPPVLLVLGAELVINGPSGRRKVAIEQFFKDYKQTALARDEFIEVIECPVSHPAYQLKVYKISKRIDDDISAILCAIHLRLEKGVVTDIKMAFGGMAAIPKRADHTEQALLNQVWGESTLVKGMKALECDFSPISDFRASANYRMQVAKNLLKKCFLETTEPKWVTRVSSYE